MPPFSFIISAFSLFGENMSTIFAVIGLVVMAALVFVCRATVGKSFRFEEAARAFNFSAGSGEGGVSDHLGKISIVM